MATIKSYTDLEQSKKLAEILPLESADMNYWCGTQIRIGGHRTMDKDLDIPCWSLAALLNVIPSDIKGNDGEDYILEIEKCDKEHLSYGLNYYDNWGRGEDIITHYYDNLIDACVEMILKLHELNLL